MIATYPGRRTGGLFVCVLLGIATVAMSMVTPPQAEAGGYRASASRVSSARPVSRPVVVKRTTLNNVVVHRTVNHVAPAPSGGGGGFFSSFTGALAGSALTNWFMNSDSDEQREEKERATASEAAMPQAPVPEHNAGS